MDTSVLETRLVLCLAVFLVQKLSDLLSAVERLVCEYYEWV